MSRNKRKTVTFVLGGVRSGKSRYAQEFASTFDRVSFIATARGSDAEMRRKIAEHRRQRPSSWKTVEAPTRLAAAIRKEGADAAALVVDCLTTYVANNMETRNGTRANLKKARLWNDIERVCQSIQSTKASVVIVSNEVGSGIVPAFRSGRLYRDLLGQLNQQIARIADRVVLMVAGVPLAIKNTVGSSSR